MPTGYTSDIYEGKTTDPREFILKVSRGLGFLIHMRDDDMDAPIRKRKEPNEDSYSVKTLQEYREKRHEIITSTHEELERMQDEGIAEAKEKAEVAEERYAELRKRYATVLAGVMAWYPTTDAGRRVKEYALEQLEESMKFDCDHDPYTWVPEKVTPAEYKQEKIRFYDRMINSYEGYVERDEKNARDTNEWIDQLMQDLERL